MYFGSNKCLGEHEKKLKYNKIVVILTGSVILNNSNCLFYLFCPSVKEDLRAFRYTD